MQKNDAYRRLHDVTGLGPDAPLTRGESRPSG